jgi:hypothetical protein
MSLAISLMPPANDVGVRASEQALHLAAFQKNGPTGRRDSDIEAYCREEDQLTEELATASAYSLADLGGKLDALVRRLEAGVDGDGQLTPAEALTLRLAASAALDAQTLAR